MSRLVITGKKGVCVCVCMCVYACVCLCVCVVITCGYNWYGGVGGCVTVCVLVQDLAGFAH